MSIRKLKSEKRAAEPSPHTRLALSVIGRAVDDIKNYDASLHRSAARFLNGSEEFYFWANVLEQDSTWLLRGLQARLQQDSPRAFQRLSQYAHPQDRALASGWDFAESLIAGVRPSPRPAASSGTIVVPPPATVGAVRRDPTA